MPKVVRRAETLIYDRELALNHPDYFQTQGSPQMLQSRLARLERLEP